MGVEADDPRQAMIEMRRAFVGDRDFRPRLSTLRATMSLTSTLPTQSTASPRTDDVGAQVTVERVRVGLNVLYLIPGEVGGTEVYARELINSLAEIAGTSIELVVFLNREAKDWPLPHTVKRVVCPVSARNRWQRYFYEQAALPIKAAREKVAVLHSLGYVAPLFARMPSIVTVHDLVFTYAGMSVIRRLALRVFVNASMRTADCVVTDSNSSREQIVSHTGRSEREVVVVHLGGDHRDVPARLPHGAKERPYFLAFSSRSRSKNISFLLRAFRAASVGGRFNHELVIVGFLRPEDALSAATTQGVRTTGQISDADLTAWLAAADYLVVPSTYEGFGLPVAEALCLGVPSLISNRGSLPEVGGEAAISFDPTNESELAHLLAKVAADRPLRDDMAGRAKARARLFSWEYTAGRMLEIYEHWATKSKLRRR
jgi:glycosyltransferase involved in cell wall biosynthesis